MTSVIKGQEGAMRRGTQRAVVSYVLRLFIIPSLSIFTEEDMRESYPGEVTPLHYPVYS